MSGEKRIPGLVQIGSKIFIMILFIEFFFLASSFVSILLLETGFTEDSKTCGMGGLLFNKYGCIEWGI